MDIVQFPAYLERIKAEVSRTVFGADDRVRLAMIAVLVKGHLLLEGPPGLAKTLFARVFSHTLGLHHRRLQCTPDLMPGDVLGANIFDFKTQTFALTKGPVFTEFLLVDEINRTPPKTQSALLEAMQERSVTIDGVTHLLSPQFMVVATQNPIEHEGTYPLPEAQLDRFLFHLLVDYPEEAQELATVLAHCGSAGMPNIQDAGVQQVLSRDGIVVLQQLPARVRVEPSIARYAVALARTTREHRSLALGISPRATTMLVASARGSAICEGRDFVIPDDIKSIFHSVVRHRVLLSSGAEMEGTHIEEVLAEVLRTVPIPR